MSKNSFVVPTIVAFVWVGAHLANFKNLSTTTKMAFVLSHSRRHVMKSIETLSMALRGLGGAYIA
jgi:hypothetical protein